MTSPISPILNVTFRRQTGFELLPTQEAEDVSTHFANRGVVRSHSSKPIVNRAKRPKHFPLISTSLCLSEFARALDAVILPVILPGLVQDLKANTSQGYMSGSSFLLCQTVFQPIWAGFAHGIGEKVCMLAALAAFAGGSVLAGLAQNPAWMIGARALQGVGAGGVDMMCNIMITKMVPLSERGKFTGLLQLFGATGLVSGMILASVIEAKFSWRWVFFINPFIAIGPFGILSVFYHTAEKTSFRSNMKKVDWGGMLLVSLSCISILYGLLTGGTIAPWTSAQVLAPLLLGGAGVVSFVLYEAFVVEKYTTASPVIPLRLFNHRTSVTGYLVTLLHAICVALFANYFFIYLHVSSSLSIINASVVMLPSSGLLFISAAIAGVYTSRTKKYRVLIIIGGVLATAGFASFISLRETASRIEQIFLQPLFALGIGMIFPARLLAPQAAQEAGDETAAAATVAFTFNLGQCFGIPIGATTYESVWEKLVRRDVKSGVIPDQYFIASSNAEDSGEIIKSFPSAVASAYRHIMAVSISNVWVIATVLTTIIIALGTIMEEVPIEDIKLRKVEAMRNQSSDLRDETVRLTEADA